MTEIPEIKRNEKALGWIGYDGTCGLCTGAAQTWSGWLLHFGASVIFEIAGRVWWGRPLFSISMLPGVRGGSRVVYRLVAKFRYRASGLCHITGPRLAKNRTDAGQRSLLTFAFLLLCIWGSGTGGWALMCALACGLWITVKYFVLQSEGSDGRQAIIWFAWPGTDGREFFRRTVLRIKPFDCRSGLLNLSCGVGLFLLIRFAPMDPALATWIGMAGLVFVLHFGLFRLLATLLTTIGIRVSSIMNFPLLARSLGDLWGNRWNLGFSVPARRYVFRPVFRRWGTKAAVLSVFLISGGLHEIVISVPAGGGYGFPTLYFLMQGLGCMIEREISDAKIVRAFAFVVAIAPVGLLFHPRFIHNVMLPFLEAIGIMGKAMP